MRQLNLSQSKSQSKSTPLPCPISSTFLARRLARSLALLSALLLGLALANLGAVVQLGGRAVDGLQAAAAATSPRPVAAAVRTSTTRLDLAVLGPDAFGD